MADKLTENQRKAVVERKNVVVSAGAGSGKTKVLSMRFADLVESGDTSADRILTLTFMNKAAVEMKSRIFNQLTCESGFEGVRQGAHPDFGQLFLRDCA